MILEPRVVQLIICHRKGNNSGRQSGAACINSSEKVMVLEPRMVQPLDVFLERQEFWFPEWCNPYKFPKKNMDSGAQSGATLYIP